ncbi:DNA-binding MurR/RpiR family transcriptional regulator [Pullulanibacillus pueri]|uniref:HTH rpiR-type domain-containing protein n=1 Tax=Pullulanibacillus pueri TaxID=1437324 RepID=A0A8J3EKI1_9BACL|nr:DNA-binding MurR/RpiR family transcriptional regulator [Pullulanibacillus pueri]GGH75379.1 hypothetical protein GCM10007096_04560 [Pullulanibacillus pueri]
MADFLLADPTTFATHSAKKVGELIGVSETMIIRLCHSLGYHSFKTLQTEIRESIFDFSNQHPLFAGEDQVKQSTFYHAMTANSDFIREAATHIDDEAINLTLEKLHQARWVLVSGSHAAFSMAHWFAFSLNLIKGNTLLFRSEFDSNLEQLSDHSALFVFSFYRYAKESLWVAEAAKNQGAYVIAVTDSPNAPINPFADSILDLKLPNKIIYKTAPIVFSFLNALLMSYSQKFADPNVLREKLYKEKANQFYAF